MDPRKQECMGRFLYGAGYFARDDNTLGLITGNSTPPHFCMSCPQRKRCEDLHERRVRQEVPAEVDSYERIVREGKARQVPESLVKLLAGRNGKDPYANVAAANFNEGHADRGRVAGMLVHSDADPRRQ